MAAGVTDRLWSIPDMLGIGMGKRQKTLVDPDGLNYGPIRQKFVRSVIWAGERKP